MPAVCKLARRVRRRTALLISACLALAIWLGGATGGTQPAAAAPRPTPPSRASLAPSASNEEEGEEGGEGSAGEEPEEGGEEGGEEESEAATLPPTECLLRSASASVVTSTPHDSVSLTVRYTSYAPSEVTVEYWLKGGRGSLQLGKARERFTERGLLHLSEHLSARAMSKARAARAFIVSLDVPAAPSLCERYAIRRLTLRRPDGGQIDWLTPGSSNPGSH